MNVRGYHATLNPLMTLSSVCERLHKSEFVPLLQTARTWITQRLKPFGVPIPIGFYDQARIEACTSKDGGRALVLRTAQDSLHENRHVLDCLLVSKGEIKGSFDDLSTLLNTHFEEHSWHEAVLARGLRQTFGKLSSNGRKLATKEIRTVVRQLYNDEIRSKRTDKDGLWLESLAADVIQERTDLVWPGQMIGEDEIDTLAIFANAIVGVECKDSNIILHDFRVAHHKAQQMQAQALIFMVTGDIDPNVHKTVERIRNRDKALEFIFVHDRTCEGLRSQLNTVLDSLEVQGVERWVTSNLSSQEYISFLLGRPSSDIEEQ